MAEKDIATALHTRDLDIRRLTAEVSRLKAAHSDMAELYRKETEKNRIGNDILESANNDVKRLMKWGEDIERRLKILWGIALEVRSDNDIQEALKETD